MMESEQNRFRQLEPDLRRLEEEAKFILNQAISASGIKIHSVSSRVKSFASFRGKVTRKELADAFAEVDDLVGVRVVCLFRPDIEKLGAIIREHFEVLTEDNKLDGTTVDVFGYQSVHFVVRVRGVHAGPRYEGLHHLRLEIQLRTVAMDAWATLSHYLDYKSEPDVPRELRKDFFALSGLFYVADTHFELFYEARLKAGAAARQEAKATPSAEQELNLDSLVAYLAEQYSDRRRAMFLSWSVN